MRRVHLRAILPLLLVPRLASPQGEPLGPEFRVNTHAANNKQGHSSVASTGTEFVVVWDGSHAEGYGYGGFGILGQRYDSGGNPLGTEFRVNTYTTGTQQHPAVGANTSGTFVVVWESGTFGCGPPPCQPPPNGKVMGQRYLASGAPVGPEFQVNTYSVSYQRYPMVAVAPSGAFLVVWSPAGGQAPPGPPDVVARFYDSSGVPQGPEFLVNTYWTFSQTAGSVAADPAGNFVVVWTDSRYVSVDVVGQRFSASGAPMGPEFRVNSYDPGSQSGPAVATDPLGNFIVAWADEFSGSPPEWGLSGRRFASNGAPLGAEFRVNTSTTVGNYDPAIAVDAAGNFVVAWVIAPTPGTGDVFGQRFSSLGVPSGPEFRINTTTVGWQRHPSVASTPDGTFLITWDTGPNGLVPDDVYGQRFGGVFPVELQDFRLK
jgi:hypothetical protein